MSGFLNWPRLYASFALWCTFVMKICPRMPTYPNAYARMKKWIFFVQFQGNWFRFGIIWNDFSSSGIWNTQIQVFFTVFQNPLNPGFNLRIMRCKNTVHTDIRVFLNRPNVRGLELDIILKGTLSLWDGSTILIGLYISSHSSPSSYLRRDRKFQLLKWTPIHHLAL